MRHPLIIFFTLFFCFTAIAASEESSIVPTEPEITIRPGGDREVHEYRANGILYAIKVVPKNGIPYFLVDSDGSGNYLRQDLGMDENKLLIPQWVLFRF